MEEIFEVEPVGTKDLSKCPCCGNASRQVWGLVHEGQDIKAAYYVNWTLGHIRTHGADIDLILGGWGEDATPTMRTAVSMKYFINNNDEWAVSVIDAETRPVAQNTLAGRALSRNNVIGTPLAQEAFPVVDAVLAQDERIAGLRTCCISFRLRT